MKILVFLLTLWFLPVCALAQSVESDLLITQLQDADTVETAQEALEKIWREKGSATNRLLVLRAQKAFIAQDMERAREHITDLVEYDATYAYGWRVYGQISAAQQDEGAAITGFLHAVAREPNDYVSWASLGMVLERIARYEEARYAYQKAATINPFDTRATDGVMRLERVLEGQSL